MTKKRGVNSRSDDEGIFCASVLRAAFGYDRRMERDYSAFHPSRIWKRLSPQKRAAAAESFWNDEQSTEQQVEAIAAVAAFMKFRTKSVVALPVEKRVRYLTMLPNMSDTIAARALINYHLSHQRPMMAAFLDSLGVAHEDGLITEQEIAKPDREKLSAAAAALASNHPVDDVSLYFSTLVSQDPDTWGDLADLPQTTA
jgi:hypothetical protein